MYCPNCGKEISDAQRFCRSCGYSFQKMIEMLDRGAEGQDVTSAADKRLQRRRKKVEFTGILTILSSLVLACVFLVIAGLSASRIGAPQIITMAGIASDRRRGFQLQTDFTYGKKD